MPEQGNEVVQPAVSPKLELTPEQQEQFDAALTARLARQAAQYESKLDAARKEYIQRVNESRGVASTVDEVLSADRARKTAEAIEIEGLEVYFGSKSSGAKANALAMKDPSTYKNMKARAVALGLIGSNRTSAPVGGHRAFYPNGL